MQKILVFTSEFDTENGQAVVTRRVVNEVLPKINDAVSCVYTAGDGAKSILSWISASAKLLRGLISSDAETIYVVCSRTIPGFVRDLPALSATFFGKRVIVHCHGSDLPDLLTKSRISSLVQFIYRRCEIIVPCRYLSTQVEDFARKVHVCENFNEEVATQNADHTETNHKDAPLLVVWNSNIMTSKGFFEVAQAIQTLVSSGLSLKFLCFGKIMGDHEKTANEVEQELSKYADQAWFTYLGLVQHSQAVIALKDCDIVALPSYYKSEMQPLAIIEAMCNAKGIIVSDRDSLRVTVGDYPADFVPIKNTSAIEKCLEKFYLEKDSNPNQFMIRNLAAAQDQKDRFSTSRFDKEITEVLQ